MNTRRNAGKRVEEVVDGGNQFPPQALVVGVQVPVNLTTSTDRELREALFEIAKVITAQTHTITAQATR